MVEIIGGNTPLLPSGHGGMLGAHVREVRPWLYLLSFETIERFAGVELYYSRRHWYGGRNYTPRVTQVSKNVDTVFAQLIGRAKGDATESLPATLQQLPEGETHDGKVTIGRSRYLLLFPRIRITVGLDFKIVAHESAHTQYSLRATTPCDSPEQIMAELYQETNP